MADDTMDRAQGEGMEGRTVPAWLVALGAYVGVTAAFMAPVFSQLGTAVMGRADAMQFLWGAWWMDQTLLEGRNPFFTDWVFVPIGSPLVFHSFAPLQSATVALASGFLPVEVAWNLVMALALPLAGLSAWALCRYVGGDAVASWVGGLAFMLSPFVAGKLGSGWLNLIFAAVLPLFTLALLRATEPEDDRRGRGLLALATLLVMWTSVVLTVFAANIAVCVFAWRAWNERSSLIALLKRCVWACVPALVLAAPYLALVAYYTVTEQFVPTARTGETGYLPHLTDFLLPTVATSPYGEVVRSWVGTEGYRFDSACYLGILVSPMAVIGLWRGRLANHAMLFGGVGVFSLALSIGPFLMLDGEFVKLFGRSVPLPFAIWREVPMLGMVGQTGRYMVIVYLAMAVGVSAFVGWLRSRPGGNRSLVVALATLAICVDFAFHPILMTLPEPIGLSGPRAIVLEPRGYVGETMYQQTLHGRPMVGGYLSRRPPRALAFYQERPGIACLMPFVRPRIPCDAAAVLPALRALGVTDVLAGRNDERAPLYHEIGLIPNESHETTVLWAVPAADATKAR